MFLDKDFGNWQFCPDGQFYSKTKDRWEECENSCRLYCAYREECYDCPQNQIFDIDSMSWVNACLEQTQVLINTTQTGNKAFWRGLKYYVDPLSKEVVELGNKRYPYKNLEMVFVELLNYFSDTNYTINIFLKEGTINYLNMNQVYLYNCSEVKIDTYATSGEPEEQAIVIGTDNGVDVLNKQTKFSVLKDATLNLSKFQTDSLSGYLSDRFKVIFMYHTNLFISNVDFYSEFQDITNEIVFIRLVQQQEKQVVLYNVFVQVSGGFIFTTDPATVNATNVVFDDYLMRYGIALEVEWNYPEAFIGGGMYITNGTFFRSQKKMVLPLSSFVIYTGSGDFQINRANAWSFDELPEINGIIASNGMPPWDPEMQSITSHWIKNSYSNVPNNTNGLKHLIWFVNPDFERLYYNKVVTTFENNVYENVEKVAMPLCWFWSKPDTQIYFLNNKFINASGGISLLWMDGGNFIFHNNDFIGLDKSLTFPFHFYNNLYVEFVNTTMSNFDGTQSPIHTVMNIDWHENVEVVIENMTIKNYKMGTQSLFTIHPFRYGIVKLKNISFENIGVTSGFPIINVGGSYDAEVDNITFTNIYKNILRADNTILINFGLSTLNNVAQYSIKNIAVMNSSVPLISMTQRFEDLNSGTEINMSKIKFQNSYFEVKHSIIEFRNFVSHSELAITVSELEFSDVEFRTVGEVLSLRHQTLAPLTISNSTFTNLKGARIFIDPFNKQQKDLKTRVVMDNVTVDSVYHTDTSFIVIEAESVLNITNSVFSNVHNEFKGSVISTYHEGTKVFADSTTFTNNSAMYGGVFYIAEQSLLHCTDCQIHHNFALQSGVVDWAESGYFEFHSSEIYENYAYTISVSEVVNVPNACLINGCQIHGNLVFSKDQILQELSSCQSLWFLQGQRNEFYRFTLETTQLFVSEYAFSLIFGILTIENNTEVYQQSSLVSGFESEIDVIDTRFSDIETDSTLLAYAGVSGSLENIEFSNITYLDLNTPFMYLNVDSDMRVDNLTLENSTNTFIRTSNSKVEFSSIRVNSVDLDMALFNIAYSYQVVLKNIVVTELRGAISSLIRVTRSQVNLLSDIIAGNMDVQGFNIQNSNIIQANKINLTNLSQGMRIQGSTISFLTQSTFAVWGGSNLWKGGAIHSIDSIFDISDSEFISNSAISGGAIHIECQLSRKQNWYTTISNSNFTSNQAETNGGAVYYDFFRPEFSNNTFLSNTAEYGPNIASYPVKIVFQSDPNDEMELLNVKSGSVYNKTVRLALLDYDGQEITSDNVSQIGIFNSNLNTSISGTNKIKVTRGIAEFDNLILITAPGSKDIVYSVTSVAIDQAKVRAAFGDVISNNTLTVDFRECLPGEILTSDSTWLDCSQGTYSFGYNSMICRVWMDNAICPGKYEIQVDNNFWRNGLNATEIVKCPRPESCLGGFVDDSDQSVECEVGYTGPLCSVWDPNLDEKYMKIGLYQCSKCPSMPLYVLRALGIIILIVLFLSIMITMNLKKTKKSDSSILYRILTNHIILLSACFSYNISYPQFFLDIIFVPESIGSSAGMLVSLDCFFDNDQDIFGFPSTAFLKLCLSMLLPLVGIILIWIVFAILMAIAPDRFGDFKRNTIVSILCMLFLMHPSLGKQAFSLFQCTEIGSGADRVTIDMRIECYSKDHILWAMIIGIPTLLIWVFGVPGFVLFIFIKNRHNLHKPQVKRYFSFLYEGLRPKVFYWEFVNIFRKFTIPFLNAFFSQFDDFYKVTTILIIFLIILRIQMHLKPYSSERNNVIEMMSIRSIIYTLFTIIPLLESTMEESDLSGMKIFILFSTIIINLYFLLKWLSFFLDTFESNNKHLKIFKKILGLLTRLSFKDKPIKEEASPSNKQNEKIKGKFKTRFRKRSGKKSSRKRRFRKKARPFTSQNKRNRMFSKHKPKLSENILNALPGSVDHTEDKLNQSRRNPSVNSWNPEDKPGTKRREEESKSEMKNYCNLEVNPSVSSVHEPDSDHDRPLRLPPINPVRQYSRMKRAKN